jgi:hypothetical protein
MACALTHAGALGIAADGIGRASGVCARLGGGLVSRPEPRADQRSRSLPDRRLRISLAAAASTDGGEVGRGVGWEWTGEPAQVMQPAQASFHS